MFRIVDKMSIYYNDNEEYVCDWIENLINVNLLPNGIVDRRDIRTVTSNELREYTQCHFFAGIGGWALALKNADWLETQDVWTGSCPCQPFSVAGRRGGTKDPRHLWPDWFRLIRECLPTTIFGEQVASKDGYTWFDIVQADLESVGYACGMVVSPAAGYGAPHIRHRIYFVAHHNNQRSQRWGIEGNCSNQCIIGQGSLANKLENSIRFRRGGGSEGFNQSEISGREIAKNQIEGSKSIGELGNIKSKRWEGQEWSGSDGEGTELQNSTKRRFSGGFWSDAEWLYCEDGKYRATKSGIFPLAHGVPSRVAKLRAIGNAIVVPQATEFIKAYMEIMSENLLTD